MPTQSETAVVLDAQSLSAIEKRWEAPASAMGSGITPSNFCWRIQQRTWLLVALLFCRITAGRGIQWLMGRNFLREMVVGSAEHHPYDSLRDFVAFPRLLQP